MLGDARQLSHVGEALRLSIPVLPDGGSPLVERCLALFGPRPGDGLPHIVTAHVAVERQGATATVLVTTNAPVREAIVRVLLRVGCDGTSRAYTLFLEPAGSTRMLRAVAQNGPRLPVATDAPTDTPALAPPIPSAAVTTIQVTPGAAARSAEMASTPAAQNARAPAATSATKPPASPTGSPDIPAVASGRPLLAPAGNATTLAPARASASAADPAGLRPATPATGTAAPAIGESPAASDAQAIVSAGPPATGNGDRKAAALEAENETLKQQVARMSGELQRLQVDKPAIGGNRDAAIARWDIALPMLIALAGLLAVIVGGLLWHRRHSGAAAEWAVGGPPSHRMASRTSLGDQPVSFRPAGVHGEAEPAPATSGAPAGGTPDAALAPAPLRLQPSPEDLARELEHELKVAERSHSALERAHPELVEQLTRCWGTAAARNQLAVMLAPGSPELTRMSGEAVAELRLLLRVAEDLPHRSFDAPAVGFNPPAPAW